MEQNFNYLFCLIWSDPLFTGGALWYAGIVVGKNICLTPSAFIMGNMILDAACKKGIHAIRVTLLHKEKRWCRKAGISTGTKCNIAHLRRFNGGESLKIIVQVHTEINLAPIHNLFGEGNGTSKRPTPYMATAKKWSTKLSGLGLRPESRATGPVEQVPPRLK